MLNLSQTLIQLDPSDNVAMARMDLPASMCLERPGKGIGLVIRQALPAGHKLALETIPAGGEVRRYGQFIGRASQPIQPGDWVHVHNLVEGGERSGFTYRVVPEQLPAPDLPPLTFQGYRRKDGRVGTRNVLAVIATVSCAARVARQIAAAFTREQLAAYPNVDAVIAITHPSGCSLPPEGRALRNLERVLANLSTHPNLAGCVLISLGCEMTGAERICARLPAPGSIPILDHEALMTQALVIQDLGGTGKTIQAGIAAVKALLPEANRCQRSTCPASGLVAALQCGGSDAWSGVTANPLLGLVSDRLVGSGSCVALAETPEIYGAEHLLLDRVNSPQTGEKLIRILQEWQRQAARMDFSLDNNPSPGNKAGGLTTIYEKSLGAVAKGGSTPLQAVYEYAERVDHPGLVFMDSPGNDPVSVTGQVASGCNLVLFTTGRGTVFGDGLAPCIKIASHPGMYARMEEDMDFNAGRALHDEALEDLAIELLTLTLDVASGRRTKGEAWNLPAVEFYPWTPGGVL